jgi:hypothetical protein
LLPLDAKRRELFSLVLENRVEVILLYLKIEIITQQFLAWGIVCGPSRKPEIECILSNHVAVVLLVLHQV